MTARATKAFMQKRHHAVSFCQFDKKGPLNISFEERINL